MKLNRLAFRRLIDPKRSQPPGDSLGIAIGDSGSSLERLFLNRWRQAGGAELEREVRLIEGRKFRFDFVHRPSRTVIELHGAVFKMGRHQRPGGFTRDCEKTCEAASLGWFTFPLTGQMLDVWVPRLVQRVRERTVG